jgi:predicted metal-binding membrane protein
MIAAVYTVTGTGMNMSAIEMTRIAAPFGTSNEIGMKVAWTVQYAVLIFLMWWVMMIAMMTPSAAPMLLLFAALKRRGPQSGQAALLSLWLLAGYLLAWAWFSMLVAGLQWGLEQVNLIDGRMMILRSRGFAGLVLLAAGLYQFTALKNACLSHCRSPAKFLAEHIRPGRSGALRMGAHHGLYCLGCCWALMVLLFVGGIMNLWWITGIAFYVLAEKMLPGVWWLIRIMGLLLIGVGGYLIITSVI